MHAPRILICLAITSGIAVSTTSHGAYAQAVTPAAAAAKVHNRRATPLSEGSRTGLRLDEAEGDGLAWWPDIAFGDGVIEFDVRGNDVVGQSFVGVAFHGADERTFDGIYFRPFNFKTADPARRAHSVQYISHPTYTWDKLRTERPNQFEREVSPAPDPNAWFHARVVVKYPDVRVFVNDEKTPCLEVKQLSDRKRGWVGVWVGNGSSGSFANVKVTPAQ